MQKWKVVEVIKGVSKLKFSGSAEKAQAEFTAAAALGTKGKLTLLNDGGMPVDEFEAVANSDTLTGKPMKEIVAPLPASLVAAAARAKEMGPILKCLEPVLKEVPVPPGSWLARNKAYVIAVGVVLSVVAGIILGIYR